MAKGKATRSSRGKKLGRPRAGQERLSRELILEAALRLVDEEGMEALNMRRLGAKLGVDPMSIYRHLPSKEAIVSGLVEKVFSSEMKMEPSEGQDWQERVRAWATAYVGLVRSHPNLVLRIVSDAAAVSDAMLQISEPLYAALWEVGLSPRGIALASDTVVDFVHGHVLAEAQGHSEDSTHSGNADFERDLLTRLEAQPADGAPTMHRVFRALAEDENERDPALAFAVGLDILLEGIEAMTKGKAG